MHESSRTDVVVDKNNRHTKQSDSKHGIQTAVGLWDALCNSQCKSELHFIDSSSHFLELRSKNGKPIRAPSVLMYVLGSRRRRELNTLVCTKYR